jgi:hypothetical protein
MSLFPRKLPNLLPLPSSAGPLGAGLNLLPIVHISSLFAAP